MNYISLNTESIRNYHRGLRSRAAGYLIESRRFSGGSLGEVNFKWYLKLKNEAEGIASLLYVSSTEFTSMYAVYKFLKVKGE